MLTNPLFGKLNRLLVLTAIPGCRHKVPPIRFVFGESFRRQFRHRWRRGRRSQFLFGRGSRRATDGLPFNMADGLCGRQTLRFKEPLYTPSAYPATIGPFADLRCAINGACPGQGLKLGR